MVSVELSRLIVTGSDDTSTEVFVPSVVSNVR
jgi:hypothetical protein